MLLRRNNVCALIPPMKALMDISAHRKNDLIASTLSALNSASPSLTQEKTSQTLTATSTITVSKYTEIDSKNKIKHCDVPQVSEFIFEQFKKRPFTHFIVPTSNFGCSLLGFLSAKLNTSPLLDINKIINPSCFLKLRYSNTCAETISSKNKINLISISSNFKRNKISPFEIEAIPLEKTQPKTKTNYFQCYKSYQPKTEKQKNGSNEKDSVYVTEQNKDFPRMICVGRGGIDAMKEITKLASLLNAKICFSRPVAEYFEKPNSQIGQTGISVSPKLYFAFGVSGAIQHLNGIKGNPKIISINSDLSKSNSFADFAVQEDATKAAKEMINILEK